MASRQVPNRRRRRAVGAILLIGGIVATVGGGAIVTVRWKAASRARLESLPRAVIHRGDLILTVTAPGWVESSEKTLIQCDLENLGIASGGRQFTAGGSSTILSIVQEGAFAQKDDVLCQLDSSAYEEIVRQQQMEVDASKAASVKAELDVQAGEIGLREYVEGRVAQAVQDYKGRMALARSDVQRQTDRLAWSERMRIQGFVSSSDVVTEKLALVRVKNVLGQVERDYQNFQTFGDGINRKTLEGQLEGMRALLDYSRLRLQKSEERLARFKRQVAGCTIRAPHDGLVIYANRRDGNPLIEVGASVRQKQDLFYLPDLSKMEVQALLHESIVDRIRSGQTTRVRVEALPQFPLEGRISSISPLPLARQDGITDLQNFRGVIALNSVPSGMKPGMSAEVEILTDQRPNVLMVPIQAVAQQAGHQICYVTHGDGLERREIRVGQMNREVMEVMDGLEEGEEVVLAPSRIDSATLAIQSQSDGESNDARPLPVTD
jgi:HlyD family secretion protein